MKENIHQHVRILALVAALAATLAIAPIAKSGPPLICHAIDIGAAQSLPWTPDKTSLAGRADYDVHRLVSDTLGLLAPGMPVLVRMETLRRAAIYAQKDDSVAKELLGQLRARALESESAGNPAALAWFDYGYLAECYKQTRYEPGVHGEGSTRSELAANVDGYSAVEKAIGLRGGDA